MRTLVFDQFEFEQWESEERLEISVAARGDFPFPGIVAFASAVLGAEAAHRLPPPTAFDERIGPGSVRAYLQRYARVTLPAICDWPMYVVTDELNDLDILLEAGSTFIRYHWETSA